MKLDKNYLFEQLARISSLVKRFRFLAAFVIFTSLYGFIIVKVNDITERTPSAAHISEKATSAPKARVDEKLVDEISALEEQNVTVKTIFSEARKNPFSE